MSEIEQEEQLDTYNAGKASEESEEREWDILFAQPHVQAGLGRLAQEAEQHYAAGEIEEGGFAVE